MRSAESGFEDNLGDSSVLRSLDAGEDVRDLLESWRPILRVLGS